MSLSPLPFNIVESSLFSAKLLPKFYMLGFSWTKTDEVLAMTAYREEKAYAVERMIKGAGLPADPSSGELSPLLSMSVGALCSPVGASGEFSLERAVPYPGWRGFLLETVQCPASVLTAAANDPNTAVRFALASVINIPNEAQEILARDREWRVREQLAMNVHVEDHWRALAALQVRNIS